MKIEIEISKQEQDILHESLIKFLELSVKARDQIISAGGILQHDPVIDIRNLHSKIISLIEEK